MIRSALTNASETYRRNRLVIRANANAGVLYPLGRSLHCLYLNQLLKHIFFLWPLTSDADIQHWQFYCFLMCFISILCFVWVLFLCTALWSTSVFFKCFINKVWLIDWYLALHLALLFQTQVLRSVGNTGEWRLRIVSEIHIQRHFS